MIKKISDKFHEILGGWAFFFGSVMADAFDARMNEIDEEHQAAMQKEEEEVMGLIDKANKKVDSGVN